MTSDRDKQAKLETKSQINEKLTALGLSPDLVKVYLRAFKKEEILEVWVGEDSSPYQKYDSYPFCTSSGTLGPKRKEGDKQIPEGCYVINRFNPKSKFYLSLGINYPNKADLFFANTDYPGSDIFIHGGCSSVGCISITDNKIKEVYTLATQSKKSGQESIRVDIYPYQFNNTADTINNEIEQLWNINEDLWNDLKSIYVDFENTRIISEILISNKGRYAIKENH